LAFSLLPVASGAAGSLSEPEEVEIASLARLYDPVIFDHSLHLDVADGCATCHHHTTGTPAEEGNCVTCHKDDEGAEVVSCRGCHEADPFAPEHIAQREKNPQWFHVDKPGLKGAYHQNCVGCHAETDAPVGCQDCHARNEVGDAFFSARAGKAGKQAAEGRHH
jgi:hypothetical protein